MERSHRRARFPRNLARCLILLAGFCGARHADAQSISTSSPIGYPKPTSADYDSGFGPVHRVTVSVSGFGSGSPGRYRVELRALTTTLGNGKPVGHVRFMRPCGTGGPSTGCGTWSTLSTTAQEILPLNEGDLTFAIDFQVTSWSWTADAPFTYEATLEFRAFSDWKNAVAQPVFRVQVDPVFSLSAANTTIGYGSPGLSDFTTGWIESGTQSTVTVKANVAHLVRLKANTSTMSSTNPSAVIPASDLQVSHDDSGSWSGWIDLDTADAILATKAAGTSSFSVRHRTRLDWSRSTTGTHSLGFAYSVVQQ